MGQWTTYCFLCGGPPHNGSHTRKYSWLNNIIVLTPKNKKVRGTYDEQGEVETSFISWLIDPITPCITNANCVKGFLMHSQCYDLAINHIPNLYQRVLSFKPVKSTSGYLTGLKYAPLYKYAEQFFEWDKFDKNEQDHYALENPSFSEKNKQRIRKNIQIIAKRRARSPSRRPLKSSRSPSRKSLKTLRSPSKKSLKTSKKLKIRKSPSQSATLYRVGTVKTGQDGNKWIIKTNINRVKRWVKLK